MKYEKIEEEQVLIVDDPIYGEIIVPYPFSKIIMTKEMQRLVNISQNGFSQLEFEKLALNNRLNHSIGAFHVMSLFLERLEYVLKKFDIEISDDDKEVALCSMLLHDIGHGPFSHSLETVTNYSHEKRTTDILLGDTEINKVITNFFGEKKVRKIASFIAEINDIEDLGHDSFTELLNNLVSYQLDADRIDYLIRDAHYVDVYSIIDLNRIISSMNVVVNNDRDYELLIDRKGLASIENVLLQRYQMYRDVYLSPVSVLGDFIFNEIIKRYREIPSLHSLDVSPSFKILAFDSKVSNLSDFLCMKDSDFKDSFKILIDSNIDNIMTYLCDFNNIEDYILMRNDVTIEKIKLKLKEIFSDIELDKIRSVISIEIKNKLYKKEQKLKIKNGNRIMDLTECTNLIKPQEVFEDTYVFFNPELLRIELGFSKDEFKKYSDEVNKMIDELNKKPEEFELKYIVDEVSEYSDLNLFNNLMNVFLNNGFKIISITKKENNDEYYDTKDLNIYKNGGSLRIRKVKQDGEQKIKATCKMLLEKGEVYSSRNEFEETLVDADFETFKNKIEELGILVNFDEILNFPILNSITERTDVVLDKNGVQVCLSFDDSKYLNHILNNGIVNDKMIEIEAIGEVNNRVILNEIHDFIMESFGKFNLNKQSIYERGINKTLMMYNLNQSKNINAKEVDNLVRKLERK